MKNQKHIDLLSVKGIAIAKAYTVGRRGSWRDYMDLYFILKNKKASLKKIIVKAKKIYGEFFSEKLFLSQLIYTEDIDKREVTETKFLAEKANLKEIEYFLKKEIDRYLFIKREAEEDEDIAAGRVSGPFKSAKDLLGSLKKK